MTQNQSSSVQVVLSQLHDGVSPYTYLGVMFLKKFSENLPPDALDMQQEKLLYLSFLNMQKAHDNIEKIIHQTDVETPTLDLFFPTLEEVAHTYGINKIILDNNLCDVSSTMSKKLGICLFELVLNQLKHNRFKKCHVKVEISSKSTYARIVFEGAESLPPQENQRGLGLKLMQQRLHEWGGSLQQLEPNSSQQVAWLITLPITE